MRYLRPFGIFNCRRSRNRRRLACVLSIEFCRRPPGSRYAGHILYTTFSRYSSSYTHLVCTNKNDGAHPTPYPHHLSGSCLPQRSYILPGTLLFHQVEALYIDKNVSFADLKQALLYFAKEMFGSETQIRLRPSYFPFTEPSAEMDISCNICGGKGCAFCKHTGWVEILGCGMVDPNVLEACGIDSKIYSGYALGMGIERVTNLKYKVKDLRMFSENDVRFLEEFESAH